jgi:CDP-diacylglycerol--serine O-phosphatidyltransferase
MTPEETPSQSASGHSAKDENGESNERKETHWKIPELPRAVRIILIILADLITFLNFASGVTAIVLVAIDGTNPLYVLWAARLILLAIIFDFSDGIPARLAQKEPGFFGTVVDSVADTVSFGFAPGVIIALSLPLIDTASGVHFALAIISIIVGLYFTFCTVFRLIRFTKAPSKKWFKGVPAPGAGCAVALYIIIKLYIEEIAGLNTIITPIVGLSLLVFTATMMIVNIRYPTTKLRKNFLEIFLLGLAAIVIISLVFVPLQYIIYPAGFMAGLTYFYVSYGPIYLLSHMLDRAKEVD